MCNDFGHRVPLAEMELAFSEQGLPLRFPHGRPNLEPRDDIWPTEGAPVVRRGGAGEAELVVLRWGFAPGRPKAGPVINLRSEGRRFTASPRCLVPASHFYEFTGARAPKAKWRFSKAGEDWFCVAGLWRPATGEVGESFALLTTAPGSDVAPLHDRQVVVLERGDWGAWLDLSRPEAELLRPSSGGVLAVEQVR